LGVGLPQGPQRLLDRAPPARRIAAKAAPTHLLQHGHASQAMVFRLGAWLKTAPAAPAETSRDAHKADNYGLSGHGTLQQM